MVDSASLKDLLILTKDGEWGKAEPVEDSVQMHIIRGTDFSSARYGSLSSVPTRFIPKHISKRKQLAPYDILIETAGGTKDQPTGRTVLLKPRLFEKAKHLITCASFSRFPRVNTELAFPEYVFWFLQYLYKTGQMERHQVQHTGVARFQYTNFAETTEIPLPPIAEQKAIAQILSSLDDKIELNQQMNQTLESIARALFKSWFIDFDPVRAKLDGRQPAGMDAETAALFPDAFEDSPLGKIPKGWKVKQLQEISSNESESFDFASHSNVIFLNTGDIAWGQFLHANYSSGNGLPGQAKKAIRKNDILISEIRPANGRYAFVDFTPTDYVVSTKFMVIRASDEIHPRLLYRVLTRPETLAELQVIADSRSGTFPQITFTSIGHLKFILSPTPIQSAYQNFVKSLDRKAKIHDLEAQSLSSIRDALLPKLLSGEIRVKDAEKMVEAVA
ncbi:restriction endonuclease subunit S [Stenomitos frigidus]|uniref:Type I restriction modification DNA specificity domain-containing protein n=1 Tax=Stenomitos frigidus ULC18 TaxID=2107698 RepID=A0A2T1DU65_9CYAN|nr:restriction endonuclease subunit S [Stenomitos frigidus]PSB24025.1 hypothetical protein C7B82_28605 [Stenomitos frigidus ULC18]